MVSNFNSSYQDLDEPNPTPNTDPNPNPNPKPNPNSNPKLSESMESVLECYHFSATRHYKAARGAHSVRRVGAAALWQAQPRCMPYGNALQAGRKGQASIKADPSWPFSGSRGLPPSRQLLRSAVGMVLPGYR